ncbi:hypothetical protein C8R42DRAFT_725679 [Lentinula raphanica]|nr:hypothetical protein C8R42DRAFT_725679 [Lentinula raphanica]
MALELDCEKYHRADPVFARTIRGGQGSFRVFNDTVKIGCNVVIQNRIYDPDDGDRLDMSIGYILAIKIVEDKTYVLIQWYMKPSELKSILKESKIGAMVLKGAARGEFILTDIEGIVESKDVMDLANIHTFVNNSADPDYHLLTSQALFYRLEYSFEHCAPRFSFVGEAENQEWLLSILLGVLKVDLPAHSNVHDVPNRRIRNTKALNELTAQEAMLLFQQGPTIRGLGWVKILYPGSLQRGIQGWLVTGNGVLMRSN